MTTANLKVTRAISQHLKDDLSLYRRAQRMLSWDSITVPQRDVIWEGKHAIGNRLAWRLQLLGGLLGEW
ncbi:hypothetical protein RJO15_11970 [Herbaspirillum huttiense F1]|uniref:hypothetical protein n=1 Tax=Herbaspirillum TaxID=963 RepID=UPI00288739F0|nr:hypothetical protein [Herbaspirillum huttiense]MDT0356492.1 hypothetical protein [Herbaspirillum huttiense F1]BEV17414.1 hypothetical protein HBDW_42020 [Herbaspirillum sp. DW155]